MKLYYKPGACSLASHIVLREIGAEFAIEAVDTDAGRTETGADYSAINKKGYVPALRMDDGEILTEGPAILQYLADSTPEAKLTPKVGTSERARMMELLTFVSSELHKAFGPLFRSDASDAQQADARTLVAKKFDVVEDHLADGRATVVPGQFTIADAYLFVVANWANFTGIDLSNWTRLHAYVANIGQRPSVQAALKSEGLA